MSRRSEVLAVRYGTWETTRSQAYLHHEVYGSADAPVTLDYYFWIVRRPAGVVVVDTGFEAEAGRRRGRRLLIDPVEALDRLGVDRAEPLSLVVTHGHYDHIGNLAAFPRATILMSRLEFHYWTGRYAGHPLFRTLAEPTELALLRRAHGEGRVRFVTDREEVASGVRVLLAPGHTPGQLMVTVDDRTLLTSDAVHLEDELDRTMPFRHMTDLLAAFGTYDHVRRLAAAGLTVVTGHDPAVHRRFPAVEGPLGEFAVTVS